MVADRIFFTVPLNTNVGGAADKPLTVDAPNTLQVKPGDRVGLSISPEAVRLLPPED